jgi:hypothetical protein
MNRPVPSHHGHDTVEGEPPRFEITSPVPLQALQGCGSAAASVGSSAAMARRG